MKKIVLCAFSLILCTAAAQADDTSNYWNGINDLFQKLDNARNDANNIQQEIASYSQQLANFDPIFTQRDQLRQAVYAYVNNTYDTLAQAVNDALNNKQQISDSLQSQIIALKLNIQNLIDQTNQQISDLQNNVNDLTNQLALLQAGYQTLQQLNTAKVQEVLLNVQELQNAYNSSLSDRQNFVNQLNGFLNKVLALEALTQQDGQLLNDKICSVNN